MIGVLLVDEDFDDVVLYIVDEFVVCLIFFMFCCCFEYVL